MTEPLRATPDDIRYAYRLLLGREPDAEGFQHHSSMLLRGGISPENLAGMFMMSAEYANRSQKTETLREVEVDGVKLYPWQGDALIGDHVVAGVSCEPNGVCKLNCVTAL